MTANLEHIAWPSTPDWPTIDGARSDGAAEVVLDLVVSEDCPWLEGHFPGRPVLPGVVQLQWAIQIAGLVWPELDTVSRLGNVKFQRPILPPAALTLTLTLNADKRLVKVRYAQGDDTSASASVIFA